MLLTVGHDPRRNAPRTCTRRRTLFAIASQLYEARRAQSTPRRKHRQRFENIRLSSAIGAEQADWAAVEAQIKRNVVAEVAERQSGAPKSGTHLIGRDNKDTRRLLVLLIWMLRNC
jgi:hypothetical protein